MLLSDMKQVPEAREGEAPLNGEDRVSSQIRWLSSRTLQCSYVISERSLFQVVETANTKALGLELPGKVLRPAKSMVAGREEWEGMG